LPKYFFKEDILADFCVNTGIKVQKTYKKKVNISFSKESIAILFTCNKYSNLLKKQNNNVHQKFLDLLQNFGKEKFNFSGKLIQSWIDQYYKEDYDWLLSRIDEKYREDFLFNPNEDGISSEEELLVYATNQIEPLVELLKDKKSIDFPLEKNPQTVAKLVNLLLVQIAKEMDA